MAYTDNLHASTKGKKAKVIITGKGNFAGSAIKKNINKKLLAAN